jgi:hypothetical protein
MALSHQEVTPLKWLLVVLIGIWCVGCGPSEQDALDADHSVWKRPSNANVHLYRPSDKLILSMPNSMAKVTLYPDKATYEKQDKAVNARDDTGLAEADRTPGVFSVETKTEALVLSTDAADASVEVRILSGAHSGDTGWVNLAFTQYR